MLGNEIPPRHITVKASPPHHVNARHWTLKNGQEQIHHSAFFLSFEGSDLLIIKSQSSLFWAERRCNSKKSFLWWKDVPRELNLFPFSAAVAWLGWLERASFRRICDILVKFVFRKMMYLNAQNVQCQATLSFWNTKDVGKGELKFLPFFALAVVIWTRLLTYTCAHNRLPFLNIEVLLWLTYLAASFHS